MDEGLEILSEQMSENKEEIVEKTISSETKKEKSKKERKKKEKPKNPVQFTPVKKVLNKYTVTGNVNSRGTKYKVVEIIEAQDDKLANSIFKERVKRNLGGVRNVTKVTVENFKEGDEPSQEEIVENLPKSEIVEKKVEEPSGLEKFLNTAKGVINNIIPIKLKILDDVVHEGKVLILKLQLVEDKQKVLTTAYQLIEVDMLMKVAKPVHPSIKNLDDLKDDSLGNLLKAYIETRMPEFFAMYKANENSGIKLEIIGKDYVMDYKEASNILNIVPGASNKVQSIIKDYTVEACKTFDIDLDDLPEMEKDIFDKLNGGFKL